MYCEIMKSKSSYHRSENTFKFQTFHERLANINVDAARRHAKFTATPEDADTFFSEGLEKWSDLNCTQHFASFRREIQQDVQTLTQVVHHQKAIVDSLQKHLKVQNSLALQPLLDLLVQLARDLQGDFYRYFEGFFGIIVGLLCTYHHDTDVLEYSFTCLAHLFKILWRCMVSDIQTVYRLFAPLLGSHYKQYIINFAAESFSFLMRKEKNHGGMFSFMLKSLEEHPDHVAGVGRLLFEMMKGVQKQFHSSTQKVLPVLLDQLGDENLPSELVYESLCHMLKAVASYTSPQYAMCVWQALQDAVKAVRVELRATNLRRKTQEHEGKVFHLTSVLRLLSILVNHQNGYLLKDSDSLVEVITSLYEGDTLPESCGLSLLDLTADLILATRCTLDQQHRPHMVQQVFSSGFSCECILEFVRKVFPATMFEKDLLPEFLVFCETSVESRGKASAMAWDCLLVLAELIETRVPPNTDTAVSSGRDTYLLNFSPAVKKLKKTSRKPSLPALCLHELKTMCNGDGCTENLSRLWLLVYVLPHMRPLDGEDLKSVLVNTITMLYKILTIEKSQLSSDNKEEVLFVMMDTVISLRQSAETAAELCPLIPLEMLLQLIKLYPDDPHCLQAVDVFMTAAQDCDEADTMCHDTFTELYTSLHTNLSSPYHQVRLLTLHILSLFPLEMKPLPDDIVLDQCGVFTVCLNAERIPLTVHTYRDRLLHLGKLDHSIVQNQLPIGNFSQIPLRYLLGNLHGGFSYMWKPLIKLIQSHAVGLSRNEFWDIYEGVLTQSASEAETMLKQVDKEDVSSDSTDEVKSLFIKCRHATANKTDKLNPALHRQLLWQAMAQFPDVCEPKSRTLVPLLFRFLNKEYYPEEFQVAPTQDILRVKYDSDNAGDSDDDDDDDNNDDNEDESKDKQSKNSKAAAPKRRPKRAANKSLVVHLSLFAEFRNPRSLYMEPQLNKLYMELMQHKDESVQKIAFKCIMTYSHKYLNPYRDNLERLLEDKSFKNELVLFSLDETTTVIAAEHRDKLSPVLMRLLYGRMYSKTGKDTAGKARANQRKNMVMKFLAGCRPKEISVFLDLVFEPFLHLTEVDHLTALENMKKDLDLSKVIPLGRQQSSLQTIDVVIKNAAHLLVGYESKLLQLVTCLAYHVHLLLDKRDDISPRWISTLKTIRTLSHGRIIQFFEAFEDYEYSTPEIDAIFKAMIWPQLEKLVHEGLYTPTPILKLFITWSQVPRYVCLLSKCAPGKPDLTPLPFVCELLLAKTVSAPVTTAIMQLVENLLNIEMEQGSDISKSQDDGAEPRLGPPIDPGSSWIIDYHLELPYGTRLLMPHINELLKYLKRTAESLTKNQSKRKRIPRRELNILSKLSVFVDDGDQGAEIIHLLLPFLSGKLRRSGDDEADILLCLTNLMRQATKPQQFLRPLAQLFSVMSSHMSRNGLCKVLQAVADREDEVKPISVLVIKLNAWDKKRVDEPDYLLRLKGFDEARALLGQPELPPLDSLLMLVHNCLFFLATTDDMSLRDGSAHCLRAVIECLSKIPNDNTYDVIIQQHLLPAVRENLKAPSEAVRHEFLTVLAALVKQFPDRSPFSDMNLLTDSDVDVDYFTNIVHIQHHRRARALRRFVKLLPSSHINTACLVSYFMPLISAILRDPIYAKASNLHDAAVEALTAVCSKLPWSHYQTVLKLELQRLPRSLDNQKLMVRVVVAVLNGFHFDLSKSKGIVSQFSGEKQKQVGKEAEDSEASSDKMDENEGELTQAEEKNGQQDRGSDDSDNDDEDDDDDKDENEDDDCDKDISHDDGSGVMEVTATRDSECDTGRQLCAEGLATRIHRFIVTAILPKLHAALAQKTKSDDVHKKASAGKYAEDEEVLRVPIALAMIKLLQSLPHATLYANLASVVMKVCQFLKSRSRDIRNTSRDTLLKMLQALGPSYFPYILKELRAALTRGYQLHVLGYTVWSLLRSLEEQLTPGDLDSSIPALTEVFREELFGTVAEEKEVDGITGKLFEAKACKSYDAYCIVARLVSSSTLSSVVIPLKQVLDNTHSHTTARKVAEALKNVCRGLVDNADLSLSSLMTFTYGLTSEALPMLSVKKEKDKGLSSESERGIHPKSCLLLKPTPTRGNVKSKTLVKTNMHIIVEFGLQVIHNLLKKSKLSPSVQQHLEMLDPFVQTLTSSLSSKYAKVTATSLRCLTWILRMTLPSLREHIETITNQLFVLLNNYAVAGAARGDNAELVVMCFKAMTVIVKDITYHKVSGDQLRVLLSYAEQDIHDYSRQATAFNLLKAILSRRLVADEISDVILKVQELSITSEAPNVRLQSRQVVMQYLLDYPLGKKLKQHIEFYVIQLDYPHEDGRLSALEMLARMFEMFPQNIMSAHCGLFFVPLASRLVNDESTKCRQSVALAIKALLTKCDSGDRDQMFSMTLNWMESDTCLIRRMAAITASLFVEVESTSFERQLSSLFPVVFRQIHPTKYDKLWDSDDIRRTNDLHLYSFLNLTLTILRECNIARKPKWIAELNIIWESLEKHLLHPHDWVRLVSAQLLGLLFSTWQPSEVAMATQNGDTDSDADDVEYMLDNTQTKLYSLCGACYKQLSSPNLPINMADQVIKNLVYLAKVLKLTSATSDPERSVVDGVGGVHNENEERKASLMWLIKRMCREANHERARTPKVTIKRSSVLKWIAAVGLDMGEELLPHYLKHLLPVVVREYTQHESSADEELKRVSGEVLELLKGVTGVDIFTRAYASVHLSLQERRADRKRTKATEAVANPEIAAKRRVKKNLMKERAKKRKIQEFRPSKKFKKFKESDT